MPRISDLLARAPLDIVRAVDITPNVIRALDRNRADFERLLRDMVSPGESRAFVEALIFGVNTAAYRKYASGKWIYYMWLLTRRPDPLRVFRRAWSHERAT
jgi:hypothetical protein